MAITALDYDRPIAAKYLVAAGITEVFRYITDLDHPQDWPKGMTLAEVEDLRRNKIKIRINRETTAKFMLTSDGFEEAQKSREWALRLGFTREDPIIYSADFLVSSGEQVAIDNFNARAALYDGKSNVWNYGQYSVVKRCLDLGYGGGWQITNSWSGGRLDPRAYAYQRVQQFIVAGVKCDVNVLNPQWKALNMATIPDTIATRWPSLVKEFPPGAPYDDSNAGIWADAGARYAAEQSDVIVSKLDALAGAQGTSGLSDADVTRIANKLADILAQRLAS